MTTPVQQSKDGLRERLRSQLAGLSIADVRRASAAIWERLSVLSEFASAHRLLVYVSTGREVDTHGLIQQLLAMGRRVCVPKFDGATQRYIASELRDFSAELMEGKFKILEPKPETVRAVAVADLDALVVPGLAFDETGNRLGRGTGYFDRILREARGATIGLAYDFQVLEEVPADTRDVAVDFIVTETRLVQRMRN